MKDYAANPAQIPVGPATDIWVTVPKGGYAGLKPAMDLQKNAPLPLQKGQVVGKLTLSDGNREIVQAPLVALTPVEKAGWLAHWWNALKAML